MKLHRLIHVARLAAICCIGALVLSVSGCAKDPADEPVTTTMPTANDSEAARNAEGAPAGDPPQPGKDGL